MYVHKICVDTVTQYCFLSRGQTNEVEPGSSEEYKFPNANAAVSYEACEQQRRGSVQPKTKLRSEMRNLRAYTRHILV